MRERAVPISRFADASLPSGGLDTSIVALTTDVVRAGKAVTGYGFSSIGRYAQSGLIRERFAPRLLRASEADLAGDDGVLDPHKAWNVMMQGEKPGGHGERSVAVGTLDMAVWDAAAKIAGLPLYRYLAPDAACALGVRVYAGGGYRYPENDLDRLAGEIRSLIASGYPKVKIKIGADPLARDLTRIDAALALLAPSNLAVDAMNRYDAAQSTVVAAALAPYGLWWFEDVCDPLDFETLAAVAHVYPGPIAAGEALFSEREARLLDTYGGLRRERDVLQFDPAHCYGIPGFARILESMQSRGWPASAFWPHGGHLYTLHLVAAFGLGGCEMNPLSFQPFGGPGDGVVPADGRIAPPDAPGIGFETKAALYALFKNLLAS
jgi:L-alanine-DL-glutamate epimerase-like enolase superfamily enzyme